MFCERCCLYVGWINGCGGLFSRVILKGRVVRAEERKCPRGRRWCPKVAAEQHLPCNCKGHVQRGRDARVEVRSTPPRAPAPCPLAPELCPPFGRLFTSQRPSQRSQDLRFDQPKALLYLPYNPSYLTLPTPRLVLLCPFDSPTVKIALFIFP